MTALRLVRREEHRARFVTWFTGRAGPGPAARETADLIWTTVLLSVDTQYVEAVATQTRIRIRLDWRLPLFALAGPEWDTLARRGVKLNETWKVLSIPLTPP